MMMFRKLRSIVIMNSMEQTREVAMNEKIYKTMTGSGIAAIVVGILISVIGLTCGSSSVRFGGRLLKKRENITF